MKAWIKGLVCGGLLIFFTGIAASSQTADEPKERIHLGKEGKFIQAEIPPDDLAPKEEYTYLPGERRDPFLSLFRRGEQAGDFGDERSPLQRVDLGTLTLVGVVKNPEGNTALIETPDGKGYFLRKGLQVGKYQGIVEEISDEKVVIREKKADFLGQIKVSDFVLTLKKEEGRR